MEEIALCIYDPQIGKTPVVIVVVFLLPAFRLITFGAVKSVRLRILGFKKPS